MSYLNDTNNTRILYREIKDMYSFYNKKFNIHTSFPMDTLISIMKPYLYLHCISKYHLRGNEIIHKSELLLAKKLDEFIKYNPKFGRKMISLNPKKNAIRNVYFNTNHPSFTISDIKKNEYTYKGSFSTNSSYSYSDSGSENYEDEDDDEDDDEYISDNPDDDDDESTTYEQPSQEININNEQNESTDNLIHTSVIIAYNRLIELGEIIEESNMEEEVPIEEPSAAAEEPPIEENKSNEEDELVIIIRSNDSISSTSNKNDDSDSDSDMSEIENENMENNILDIENISIASSTSSNSSNES